MAVKRSHCQKRQQLGSGCSFSLAIATLLLAAAAALNHQTLIFDQEERLTQAGEMKRMF